MSASPPDPSPDLDSARTAVARAGSAKSFGPYRLHQRIGEGGMGEVWMAEQTAPIGRKVVVKVIEAGMDTAQVVARFEAERQALALMDHPAIATVCTGLGVTIGMPEYMSPEQAEMSGLDIDTRTDVFALGVIL